MKLEYKCVKCGCRKCIEKTAVIPERKAKKLKFEIGTYYVKICSECGYTEFYSAKIVDAEKERERNARRVFQKTTV